MRRRPFQPFPFDQLPSYSTDEVCLINRVAAHQSASSAVAGALASALAAVALMAQKYVEESLSVRASQLMPLAKYQENAVGRGGPVAVVSVPSLDVKLYIQLPLMWAKYVVDRLLGGDGRLTQTALPLTAVEEGVLEFLLLKVVQAVNAAETGHPWLSWQYDRLVSSSDAMASIAKHPERWMALPIDLHGSAGRATAALIFDAETLSLQSDIAMEDADDESRLLALCAHMTGTFQAEVGRVSLSYDDQRQLEEGDVLLFDDALVALDGSEIQGAASLRFDLLPQWAFESEIAADQYSGDRHVYQLTLHQFQEGQ